MSAPPSPNPKPRKGRIHCDILRMESKHIEAVASLEAGVFAGTNYWLPEDFKKWLNGHHTHGVIAKHGRYLIGYLCYGQGEDHLQIANVAVSRGFRRGGVGTALVRHLTRRVNDAVSVLKRIECLVDEANLDALLWLRALGFLAEGLARDEIELSAEEGGGTRDVIRMVYHRRELTL